MTYKDWITCTPVAFRGDEKTFFSRDSGLCSRTLQALGAQAKVVMPEPEWDDESDVLRVPYGRLGDPGFWREQNSEAVIYYSWADPRHTPIARAIKAAGLKLFINIDTGGLISPFVEPWAYIRMIMVSEVQRKGWGLGSLFTACRLVYQCVGIHKHLLRLRHMNYADAIGVVSPIGAERIKRYARFFGRDDIARKIHFVSHPIDQAMNYGGCSKYEQIIIVGRWDDSVKRPELLIAVAVKVLSRNTTVRFVIVGKEATRCVAEIEAQTSESNGRVVGYERLEHDQLCEQMCLSQISLCTSYSEGFHTVSGEALLCGCSIVAPLSPYLPSLTYFVGEGHSGRLSKNNPDSLAEAVLMELVAWQHGRRDPAAIANTWSGLVGCRAVVQKIDALLSQAK